MKIIIRDGDSLAIVNVNELIVEKDFMNRAAGEDSPHIPYGLHHLCQSRLEISSEIT